MQVTESYEEFRTGSSRPRSTRPGQLDHQRRWLSRINCISVSESSWVYTKFYDRKHDFYQTALLTPCYTQHALRPYIDSKINNIRHFIKIPFINKGIDFIDLLSIFRNNTIESSIPNSFENKEPPIICYKHNKPIRSTIFNLNKLISDLDIF